MGATAEDVAAWLGGPGAGALRRAAQRAGVAYLVEDLAAEVVLRTVRALAAGTQIEEVGAWSTRLAHRAAVDLLRVERRYAPVRPPVGGPDEDAAGADPEGAADVAGDALALAQAASLRRVLAARLDPAAWVGAACLAVLAVRVDGAAPGPSCPQPAGGTGEADAARWAGLWYAGQHGCFPGLEQQDGPGVRQRRRRASLKVDALLRSVAEEAGVGA